MRHKKSKATIAMPKNLVIFCDGTGNQFGNRNSNVLKLFAATLRDPRTQLCHYDPGVGTLARSNPWKKALQDASAIFGLATGYGLDDNVLAAYEFLVDNYEKDDAIYLFGFSRGAYTVRVLAGLIDMRLPLTFVPEDVAQIARIIGEEVRIAAAATALEPVAAVSAD